MLCIEHTFGVDTRGISLVYVLCAKYLKNCSSTNCTKKVQFLHKISLNALHAFLVGFIVMGCVHKHTYTHLTHTL